MSIIARAMITHHAQSAMGMSACVMMMPQRAD